MTIDLNLGQPALFTLDSADELEHLSTRERRLLVGALNFHALLAAGRTLTVHMYAGGGDSLPRTTDDATFTGLSRSFRARDRTFSITSTVAGEARELIPAEGGAATLAQGSSRHIYVSEDAALEFDPPRNEPSGTLRKALRKLRTRTPLIYDEVRDIELLRHRGAITRRAERRQFDREFEVGGSHADSAIVPVPEASPDAPKAVLLGLHWFELGGAERWALETVKLIRDAGFLPIVLTNRDSHQPWIDRPELDGALILPFSEPTVDSQTPGVEELLRSILRTFDVRGIVVHHNQWLYDRLHWISRSRPMIPIIDSTHIIEYRGGGFPHSSVRVEEVISAHHVISPSLERWMVDIQGVDPAKVIMAPLGGLTVTLKDATFRARVANEPFTVAFVGRMARQKAPEVFVEMAKRLQSKGHDFRFIMHGDGEMATWVDDLIASRGLGARVVRRDSTLPVSMTLEESHVLVVTSHNEGLTLTTLEAIAHGVPVVSTDVGSQSDVIPPRALVSRNVHRSVREAATAVAALAADEEARSRLWRDERKAEKKLLSQTSASEWFSQEVRSW